MLITLIKNDLLINFTLPSKVTGSYFITDKVSGEERNLISVEGIDDKWILKSNFDVKILNGNNIVDFIVLNKDNFYTIKVNGEKYNYLLYCTEVCDNTYVNYMVNTNEITIGNTINDLINYNCNIISANYAKIKQENNVFTIESTNQNNLIFVNGKRIQNMMLTTGDLVFIMGLKILIIGNSLFINNPASKININQNCFTPCHINQNSYLGKKETGDEEEILLYDEQDYFYRAPRFVTSIEKENISFDSPPEGESQKERPIIYTVGPMLTMAMSSCIYGVMALGNVLTKKSTISESFPTLLISFGMLMSVFLWPSLMRRYEKKEKKAREKLRQEKYREYLKDKQTKIETLKKRQTQILLENNLGLKECQNIILMKKRNLWERKIEHDDFLSLRLGLGNTSLAVELNAPSEHFSLSTDDLKETLAKLVSESHEIENVPICLSLTTKNNVVVVGNDILRKRLLDNLILELIAFHSYEDVKLVFMIDNDDYDYYKKFKILPFVWDNLREMRFFAENYDEASKISFYLEQVFSHRKYSDADKITISDITYKDVSPYYVIITNSIKKMRNLEIINQVLAEKRNLGFSIIILNDGLSNLPNECSNFIVLDENKSAIIENDLNINKQKTFMLDNKENIDMYDVCKHVANIPIKFSKQNSIITNSIGFLEMYNVGKVEQLNAINRWHDSSPIHSLSCPIGVTKNEELLYLDLHEKFHGPHGLIAGMTGSGKSELIITFILSMAVNYSPLEVQFVLIDYKGGGLAGAFENKDTGYKLPHIVGTLTNLDTTELKRSFASIQSELRRRQQMFNKAKETLGESTIDIYKYQKAYRDGKIDMPISHLFIICDEFAELKVQQPEFMDQLISIARIGRSLGIHLILATQKPSGIVDDQIWSNSRFRICLKVQEKSDSMDVIKRPDAVSLKNAGRFYLQVGYNDLFALGQSAWCGGGYFPTDKLKKKIDRSLSFITNIGNIIKSADDSKKNDMIAQGEELGNIVRYLSDVAQSENIKLDKLWLDRIPDIIYIGDLIKKYNYESSPFEIDPVIGEYDDPENQRQGLLTINLTDVGNTLIYGYPGSGKDLLLSTIIYSTILDHTADEVNFYILDFGSETLNSFADAAQIGDIILKDDREKITNIFKNLMKEIEKRKELFANYNGDYKRYCMGSGNALPMLVIIINNYEAFSELYDEFQDTLITLTRDGQRYGITFIISTSGVNSIRYKLSQNFKEIIALSLNDKADYLSVLGNTNNVFPSKSFGRGIIRINDKVCEFQTAYPYDYDNLSDYLKVISQKLIQFSDSKASEVAILPDRVTENLLEPYFGNLSAVPIGISKSSLTPCLYNFKDNYMTIIGSRNIDINFTSSLVKSLTKINNLDIMIIDTDSILDSSRINNVLYCNNNLDEVSLKVTSLINNLMKYKEAGQRVTKEFVCVIISLDEFRSKITIENKKAFDKAIIDGLGLGNIRFIIIDTMIRLKKMEYESFYMETVNKNSGIYLGDGITDQFVIKLNNTNKEMTENIGNNFGYVILQGKPTLIKLINYEEGDYE